MSSAAAESFRARFRKVLEYIDAHLSENLDLERLSAVAAFSKYHFHRQFTELYGVGVYRYVQLMRLKRAGYQLAFREDRRIVEIALESGYEGPEAFARAFRKVAGQSPSGFRKQPQWDPWLSACQPVSDVRIRHMNSSQEFDQVRIVDFRETRVAVLEHRGDPRRIGDSIRRFIAWRRQNNLPPRVSATFNILYDDPADTDPDQFRLDLCVATERDLSGNSSGIVSKTIPGGRCATLRHVGSDDALHQALAYVYSQWLPQSGEEPRDFPLFIQRVSFFPDVPEHEAVTDVFVPLR